MKVGDTVRIKTNLRELNNNEFGINSEMFAYEGAIAHIVEVDVTEDMIDGVNFGYFLDIDNGNWIWSENLLERVNNNSKENINTLVSDLKDKIENIDNSLRNKIKNIEKERDELRKENKKLKERLKWRVNYCQELEYDLYESMKKYIEKDKVRESMNKIREILYNLNGGKL